MTIVIEDSTLVEWSEAAMVREDVFKELRTILLERVEFIKDPVRLIGVEPISSSVESIHLAHVDGSRFLSLVGNNWKGLIFFNCLWCGLTTFPDVVYHMPRLTLLALVANNLTSIPEDWRSRSKIRLQMIVLDLNPLLTELPDSMWQQAATCGVFSAMNTNLSAVPSWIADIAGPDFLLAAANTPLCNNLQAASPRVQSLVACT